MKRIKDVSHMAGITKRTLQYYDDQGLLYVKRSKNNERIYTKEELRQLWIILMCKDLGMKLSQIKDFLNEDEAGEKDVLKEHIDQLKKEKEKMERRICLAEKIYKNGIPAENFQSRKENPDEYMKNLCKCFDE